MNTFVVREMDARIKALTVKMEEEQCSRERIDRHFMSGRMRELKDRRVRDDCKVFV